MSWLGKNLRIRWNEKFQSPMAIVIGVCISALIIRIILDSDFATSTLLYILVPFFISIGLYFLTNRSTREGMGWGYLNHLRDSTIIFLATSALLMEGFLCVLMFMPIYYVFVTIGYVFAALFSKSKKERGEGMQAFVIPALIFVLASEGMLPSTTVPRHRTATYVTVTNQSIDTLKHNMAAEIEMPVKRNWFLRLFPMPDNIVAGSLASGDIHNLHFTYKKWGFGNFHTGEMDILIKSVEPQLIRTEIVKNTSYLAHYMNIEGTEVFFTPLADGGTQVSLTVKYERLLDPSWYFGPMQQLAAKQSAEYLVETIIIRRSESEDER